MTDVRAFVGHSFSPEDEDLVHRFTLFFTQLSGLVPGFTWEHATEAQTRQPNEKVLALFDGKSHFIGICSRKERVISPELLAPTLLSKSRLVGEASDFEWKTSDWIIQEIGLAVGRNLKLILLVEEGVRRPGGLQADIEYIGFSRDAPELAFGKITEMLKGISPATPLEEQATSEQTDAPERPTEVAGPKGDVDLDDYLVPKGDWDRARYRSAAYYALLVEKPADAERISDAYLAKEEVAGEVVAEWHAIFERVKILSGSAGSLEKLKEAADALPENAAIRFELAGAYEHFGSRTDAAREYASAAALSVSDEDKVQYLGLAAAQLAILGDAPAAEKQLQDARLAAGASIENEKALLRAIKEVARIQKNENLVILTMERLVALDPSDTNMRFSLAYAYSQASNGDISFYHYTKIPYARRDGVTWNNLGVAFGNMSLPGKSVAAYRISEKKGESLAMSNLANKLLDAGFFPEATAILNNAVTIENYHKNVGTSLSSLRSAPEKEDEDQEKALKAVEPKAAFFRALSESLVKSAPSVDEAAWKGPDCPLALSLEGNTFKAVGRFERNFSALAYALGGSGTPQVLIQNVEYVGQVVGGRIYGSVNRWKDGDDKTQAMTSLLSVTAPTLFEIYENAKGDLAVMENPASTTPTIYEIVRS